MILLSTAMALSLSYEEALQAASERNVSVLGAAQDVLVAEGALLAARAPYGPMLSAGGSWYSDVTEGYNQNFGSDYFQDAGGWNTDVEVSQQTATGTGASIALRTSNNRFLYRLRELDLEFDSEPTYNSELAISVSQALLQGNRLAYNLQSVRVAARSLTVAEATRRSARQQALAETARAYWQLYQAERAVEIAHATVGLQVEQQRVTVALVESGKLAAVERTRIDAAVAQAQAALMDAENALATARDTLLVAVGADPGDTVTLTSTPARPPDLVLDEAQIVEAVLAGNQDLAAARLRAEGATANWSDAKHALLPELSATAGATLYGFDTTLGGAVSEIGSGNFRQLSLGGQLTVPLLNRADRGSVNQRAGEAEAARLDAIALETSLSQQARAQVRSLEAARRQVELAELNVRLAEETLTAERARLTEGKTVQKDVILAVKDYDSARVTAQGALKDYQLAVVELERLKGAL